MKFNFPTFILALCASLVSLTSFSQTNFEGTISSEMTATKVPAEMVGMEAMFNTSMSMTMKGNMSKVEIQNSMQSSTIITNESTRKVVMLIDIMGSKYAVEDQLQEGESQGSFEFSFEGGKVELTNETKMIAGYHCKKAIFTSGDDGDTFKTEVWYAEEINNSDGKSPIPGMPMEYSMKVEGVEMHYVVTKVTKGNVSDSDFAIPAGYTKKTMQEFQELMSPAELEQH